MSLVKSAGDKSLEELANQIKNNTSMPITKESSVLILNQQEFQKLPVLLPLPFP